MNISKETGKPNFDFVIPKIIVKDPYQKICGYRCCRKPFIAKRTDQDYCCPDHKSKENNHIQRLERLVMNERMQEQKINERILGRFYREKHYIVTRKQNTK